MNKIDTRSVLLNFADTLRASGSWCGETHLQKALYFLKALTDVPLPFDFVLWKHGPYSFDLHDELSELLGYGLLDYQIRDPHYGPSLIVTERGKMLVQQQTAHAAFGRQIGFIATQLASKGVVDLEKLGTALLVTKQLPAASAQARAERLHELKPHVPEDQALQAVEELDLMQAAWAQAH
ncbi:MAG: hypothetical protein ABFE07_04395 [Armatimonadia bacterium]